MSDITGVVVTGIYGIGKSSVVEEMAGILEADEVSYSAIDVDWLWWFYAPGIDDKTSRRVLFANLKSVVVNYVNVGVTRFLFAWSIQDQQDLNSLSSSFGFPLRVVRLTAPISTIKNRLAQAVTTEREQDLLNAERWLKDGTDSNLGDFVVASDRPIREVATEILRWLGWQKPRL